MNRRVRFLIMLLTFAFMAACGGGGGGGGSGNGDSGSEENAVIGAVLETLFSNSTSMDISAMPGGSNSSPTARIDITDHGEGRSTVTYDHEEIVNPAGGGAFMDGSYEIETITYSNDDLISIDNRLWTSEGNRLTASYEDWTITSGFGPASSDWPWLMDGPVWEQFDYQANMVWDMIDGGAKIFSIPVWINHTTSAGLRLEGGEHMHVYYLDMDVSMTGNLISWSDSPLNVEADNFCTGEIRWAKFDDADAVEVASRGRCVLSGDCSECL